MPISYNSLFLFIESHGKNKYWLRQNGLHPNTVDRLKNNGYVSTEIIERVCKLLDCQPGDIMEYVPDETATKEAEKNGITTGETTLHLR